MFKYVFTNKNNMISTFKPKLYTTNSYKDGNSDNPKKPNNINNLIITLILGFYFIHLKNR
jgi:hypothetical protein